jgi:hypothetical protein
LYSTCTGADVPDEGPFVHVTTHWYQVDAVGVAVYVKEVAPVMFVQGPVAVAADCHWYVIPKPVVAFCKDNVLVCPAKIEFGLAIVFPGVGVPAHGGGTEIVIQ